ncbi:MAG: aldose 1-epimerase family protein [bacterium]
MAGKAKKTSWVLTDTSKGVWVESLALSASDLGIKGFPSAGIRKYTLRGGFSDGVDVIEVNNGTMSITILPTRGMGILDCAYKGNRLGWSSPVKGPVNPKFVNLADRGGLGWLQGFNEVIVRCGLESNGAPGTDMVPNNKGQPSPVTLGLHGRIANIPAHYVEVSVKPGAHPELCVTGIVDEAMLFCPQLRLKATLTTGVGSNAMTITDEVTNTKDTVGELELLYHCNFGEPFLGRGSRLLIPASETAPRDSRASEDIDTWHEYLPPTPGYAEQCYWHVPLADGKGNTVAMLENSAGNKGVAIRFNVKQLPCFTQWKCTGGRSEGYVTGLEPATNYPNSKQFEREQGRVIKLQPGATYTAQVVTEVYDTAAGVRGVEQEIKRLQARPRKVHRQPQLGLSPGV